MLNLDFSGGTYADGTSVLQIFASTGFVSIAAVPEPSTHAMALFALACGGYSMLRRRKQA